MIFNCTEGQHLQLWHCSKGQLYCQRVVIWIQFYLTSKSRLLPPRDTGCKHLLCTDKCVSIFPVAFLMKTQPRLSFRLLISLPKVTFGMSMGWVIFRRVTPVATLCCSDRWACDKCSDDLLLWWPNLRPEINLKGALNSESASMKQAKERENCHLVEHLLCVPWILSGLICATTSGARCCCVHPVLRRWNWAQRGSNIAQSHTTR